uniref:NADH-ubiquinone oxidoreductase chain 4L n=1 Tax=Caenis robusta TaxID=446426 RepID=A0A7D6ZVG9_9INSE|nr:NADH dehydrogenase subunit 4L [Caenis robusta]UJG45445.1 NADH dehydrogenase subunit 4L [Caenis robusta]
MLTHIYIVPFIITLLMGLLGFVSNRKHLLATLLSLEMMVLGLYGMVIFISLFYWGDLYISMIFLTFTVCEGALGLGVLVFLVRSHGNDFFQTFNVLRC